MRQNIGGRKLPRNLIKLSRRMNHKNKLEAIQDIRTAIILDGLRSHLPKDFISPITIERSTIGSIGSPLPRRYMNRSITLNYEVNSPTLTQTSKRRLFSKDASLIKLQKITALLTPNNTVSQTSRPNMNKTVSQTSRNGG